MSARAAEDVWTVRRMLAWMAEDFSARGISTARLDAEVLLAHALGTARVKLYLDMERPLDPAELGRIRALIKRRRGHEPIAYILGQREFYSRAFAVDRRVLIPRPDTELLVDRALACVSADAAGDALDLCTGSGCVGITLALERPGLRVVLTDVSPEALEVARTNAEALGVADRVSCCEGDLWDCVPACDPGYRVIVANPPYIRAEDLAGLSQDITRHEPRLALVADADGLSFYQRIAARAREFLASRGHVLVEVGEHQAEDVSALFGAHFAHVRSFRDLGGIPRVVVASDVVPAEGQGTEPRIDETQNVDGVTDGIREPAAPSGPEGAGQG